MLKNGIALGLFLAAGVALAAEPVASGPQPGEKVPGPFKPLQVNGPDAGKEDCIYCKNGAKPVVMVFVRELTPNVVTLIKKLDAATAAKSDADLATCVIVLSDEKDMASSLGKWAASEKINNTILATYASSGPEKYAISTDAAVTVLLYAKRTVKANYSYRAGAMTAGDVNVILGDLAKIVP